MSDAKIIDALLNIQPSFDGELRVDSISRTIYSTDASAYQETPAAVAIPKTVNDIRQLIEFANQFEIGLILRAAGTSLAGQVVGNGIVVDISRHFTQILEIDAEEKWVRVQPGVIRNELNLELAKHGLLFGPETSTANRAMIGGMVGNNSCGSNSIVYGSTREQTLEVRGFLSDGSEATFAAVSDQEFKSKCDGPADCLESSLYREVSRLLSEPLVRDEIQREFPKPTVTRRNTGYALDLLMDASPLSTASQLPFNFCKLLAGSEGTLFFATEIKLQCSPLPPAIEGLLCVHFNDVAEALTATQIAMKHQPWACELIDRFIIEGANRNIEQRENASFVEGNPGAILVVEVRGETKTQALENAKAVENDIRSANLGWHFPVLFGDDTKKVWELRKAGLGIVGNVPGDSKPCAVIEDTAVAIEGLAGIHR